MAFLNINRLHIFCFIMWQIALFYCTQQIFPIFFNIEPSLACADRNFTFSKQECDLSQTQICNELKNCSNWSVTQPTFRSMAGDFGLYCDKAYDATLASTIQFLGVLVGTIVYGHLGDQFGRKPVSLIGITIGIAFAIGSGFAQSWQVFAALRFVCGSSVACVLIVYYTYTLELIRPEQRVFLRAFFNWGYARVMFTFVCWLCGYWRSAAVATALLASPLIPVILFVLPETPKWYRTKGREKDALEAERRIEWLSGEETKEEIHIQQDHNDKVYSMKDLFVERTITINTIVLGVLWFCTSLSAYGSDLSSGNLAGNFYVTQFVSGLVTAIAKIFMFVLDEKWPNFNRRVMHQLPQSLMIVCYATIMFIMIFVNEQSCDGDTWNDWTVIIINIIGISLIEATWDACYLVAAESFPTHVRTIGVGACSMMARIGALIAPQMAYLSNIYKPAPYFLVCAIGILSLVISFFFLPNTKGVDLATIGQDDPVVGSEKSMEKSIEARRNEKVDLPNVEA